MKKLLSLLVILASSSAFAEMPNAITIVSAILRDSGLHDVNHLKLNHLDLVEEDQVSSVWYKVEFEKDGRTINCAALVNILTEEVNPGAYIVDTSLGKCFDQSRFEPFKLENDYTDRDGESRFTRVFSDNNTKFSPLSHEQYKQLTYAYTDEARKEYEEKKSEHVQPYRTDHDVIAPRRSHK